MKPVIVTIDTEGHVGKDPIQRLIYGETESGRFGIEYIMDVFDEYQAKVLFFVDFAEAWDYGRKKVENLVRLILQRGHDVGVHIHPDHMADKDRAFLWQYSRDEQYDIIKKCTDLYVEITGKKPLSFRAGKYGANHDTLDILCELGYRYDFSQFYHQKWCGINPPVTVNAPCRYKSLTEFPVTMHKSIHLGKIVREDKIDIEQMTCSELRYALNQATQQKFPMAVTLFFHSFSLLKWRSQPDNPVLDKRNLKRLLNAAKYVNANTKLQFISEKDLAQIEVLHEQKVMETTIEWKSQVRGFVYTYIKALSIVKHNRKAKLLVGSSILAIGITISLFIVLFAWIW